MFVEVVTHPWLNDGNIIIDRVIGDNLIELKKKHLPQQVKDNFGVYF